MDGHEDVFVTVYAHLGHSGQNGNRPPTLDLGKCGQPTTLPRPLTVYAARAQRDEPEQNDPRHPLLLRFRMSANPRW
jgi:hypothetical protein